MELTFFVTRVTENQFPSFSKVEMLCLGTEDSVYPGQSAIMGLGQGRMEIILTNKEIVNDFREGRKVSVSITTAAN